MTPVRIPLAALRFGPPAALRFGPPAVTRLILPPPVWATVSLDAPRTHRARGPWQLPSWRLRIRGPRDTDRFAALIGTALGLAIAILTCTVLAACGPDECAPDTINKCQQRSGS